MGHPWESLFYRFKGLGNCISKLANSFGIGYEKINERNPTTPATTPLYDIPSISVEEDPTSGVYRRRICQPLIAPKTILRKNDGTGNRIALVDNKAKLLVSKHFIYEEKPIEPLYCNCDVNIVQFGGWRNYVDMTIAISGQTFSGNGIWLGAQRVAVYDTSTREYVGSFNRLYYTNYEQTSSQAQGLTYYTVLAGINGEGNGDPYDEENALFLVTDNVFSDTATYPPYIGISTNPWGINYGAKVKYLQFSQSWRGTGLIRDMLSRTGMEVLEEDFYSMYVDSCSFYGYDYLKMFVQNTYGANGGNALGNAQWEAIIAKDPWAGNWYLNGQFVMSVGYTSFNLESVQIDVELPAVDTVGVGGAELWGGDSASLFFSNYPLYQWDDYLLHLTHNSNVPRITSMQLSINMYGHIEATEGGKVIFKIRASDRWKGASSAERQSCYWSNGNPYCWLSSGVEAVYINATTGQSYQLTPTRTLGVLTRYELTATPYEVLGDSDNVDIEVNWQGTCNRIGAQNWAELYANDNWAYNIVNVDAVETCSYKHWY